MPKPTAKGFTTSRLARSFSSEQMPPLYVAMNPPTLRADCMPDRMADRMTDCMPDCMPGRMPDRMPERCPTACLTT